MGESETADCEAQRASELDEALTSLAWLRDGLERLRKAGLPDLPPAMPAPPYPASELFGMED